MIFDANTKTKAIELPLNWGVDYMDGTSIKEYTDEGEKVDYYSISPHNIDNFGLFNDSVKLFYQKDGTFYLNKQLIEIEYHVNDKIYNLTCNFDQKDCITYKQAGATLRGRGELKPELEALCFGYKTLLTMNDDTQFYFKPIVIIPMIGEDKRAFIEVSITSNKKLKGNLVFKNKSKIVDVVDFPINLNNRAIYNWVIK